MKILLKIITGLFGLALVLIAALFIVPSLINSPGYAWRVLTLLSSDTQDYKVFPSRPIENGTTFSRLDRGQQATPSQVSYQYKEGVRNEILEDLLQRTKTSTFLIVKDDQLIYETYLESSRSEFTNYVSNCGDRGGLGDLVATGVGGAAGLNWSLIN